MAHLFKSCAIDLSNIVRVFSECLTLNLCGECAGKSTLSSLTLFPEAADGASILTDVDARLLLEVSDAVLD